MRPVENMPSAPSGYLWRENKDEQWKSAHKGNSDGFFSLTATVWWWESAELSYKLLAWCKRLKGFFFVAADVVFLIKALKWAHSEVESTGLHVSVKKPRDLLWKQSTAVSQAETQEDGQLNPFLDISPSYWKITVTVICSYANQFNSFKITFCSRRVQISFASWIILYQ